MKDTKLIAILVISLMWQVKRQEQVGDICNEYPARLDLIDQCPVDLYETSGISGHSPLQIPTPVCQCAHYQKKTLKELNNKTVQLVRK